MYSKVLIYTNWENFNSKCEVRSSKSTVRKHEQRGLELKAGKLTEQSSNHD